MPKDGFVDYVVMDLLSGLRGVTARAMFGEHSLYLDDVIFGIVADDVLYFKVDDANRPKYEAAGSREYAYVSGGKKVPMPYWEVPASVLEDREELARWAEESQRITLKTKKCR